MFRWNTVIVLILIALVPLSGVYAQRSAGHLSISGFGTAGMPVGPEFFKDYYEMGFGYGGSVRLNLSDYSAIGADIIYMPFKIDSDAFIDIAAGGGAVPVGVEVEIDGGNVNTLIISAAFVQYFTPPSSPIGLYAVIGGGYYTFTPTDLTVKMTGLGEMSVEAEDSESGFGFSGGFGLELAFTSSIAIFAEGRYHYTLVEMADIPEEMGESGKIHFIGIIGGVRVTL